MGFLKSLFGLFGKSETEEAPTIPQPMLPSEDDDEDRTTVMTRKQFKDATDRNTERTGGKK